MFCFRKSVAVISRDYERIVSAIVSAYAKDDWIRCYFQCYNMVLTKPILKKSKVMKTASHGAGDQKSVQNLILSC